MRILYLLFPLLLLLAQGAAAGKHDKCIRRGGFCALFSFKPPPTSQLYAFILRGKSQGKKGKVLLGLDLPRS
uniref:Uncharacterized protein n=1 Tax=Malurus cyaneus samueli TaxID=2593467 RepID=A0A8C5U533_9PASS